MADMTKRVPIKVMVFPGGMENGLEICQSLKACKEVELFAASSPGINHAPFAFRRHHIVRDVRESGWVEDLNKAILAEGIDLVFPANSVVIDHLVDQRENLAAPVLLPDSDVVRLTRSKKKTIACLRGALPLPVCYDAVDQIDAFPVFAKLDGGYGGQGASVIKSRHHAENIDFAAMIVQECLPGREYTVDCFSDSDSKLLYASARERVRVRMGTSMHAERVSGEIEREMRVWAEAILSRIKLTGAWFFQAKEDAAGALKFLEIDARIAGTMCYSRARGANLPLLSIHQFMGNKVSIRVNEPPLVLDRCLRNRYFFDYAYDAVYVDLDDTLVLRGRINTQLVQFLYQCVNEKVRLVLLTKNLEPDVSAYLKGLRLLDVFDEIVHIAEHQSKADFIAIKPALFIDDSFSQRAEVAARHGIPTFDASMIEALLDDRW